MTAARRKRSKLDLRSFYIVSVRGFLAARVEETRAETNQIDHQKAKITLAQFDALVADIAYDPSRHRP